VNWARLMDLRRAECFRDRRRNGRWQTIGIKLCRALRRSTAGNRNVAQPVNAILNYAYATLESEIRIRAISEAYDPTIGIMHEGSDGSSKFISI
jgi:CRISPR/Cas system-associated endonuclease Cas1